MTNKPSTTQYLAIQALKRSHSKLHEVISRSDALTSVLKEDVARIIAELSQALAKL